MEKLKSKALSLRIDEEINSFIESFSQKISLSKTETVVYMLKRSIGIFKFENSKSENSILKEVLKIIDSNPEVTELDKRILTTIYRLLDLDMISEIPLNEKITKTLKLSLINKLLEEDLTIDGLVKHIKKMDHLIEHFSPYYLVEVNQTVTNNFLNNTKTRDTTLLLGITSNVVKYINREKNNS